MLQAGQVIRYGPALYRVEYANQCRAKIVPLGRKVDPDGAGINISPNSFVTIITDLAAAQDQLELEAVERELAAAKAEIKRRDAPQPVAPSRPAPAARRAPAPAGGGWYLTDAPAAFKEGTLAEKVWLFIGTNPGLPTAAIVEGVGGEGAIAACVSRFNQAGLIAKR